MEILLKIKEVAIAKKAELTDADLDEILAAVLARPAASPA